MSDSKASSRFLRHSIVAALCVTLLNGCGDDPQSLLKSAKEYLARNDVNAAAIQLKNALQKDGSLAEARFLLGRVNLELGNLGGAVKELRRAAEHGYPEAEVSPLLARALVLTGDFDAVLKEFEGKTLDVPSAQAALLGAVGTAYLSKGDVGKARASFEAATASDSTDVQARIGLGRVKLIAGDPDGALADADFVLNGRPNVAEAHALRADVYMLRKQTPEAIAALESAVKARPGNVSYHFALVSTLLRERQVDAAVARLAEMRKVAAAHPSTRYLQALVDMGHGKVSEARDSIAEAVRLAPDFLPARLLAGVIYLRLNQQPLAQEQLGVVVARAPKLALARRLLATSLLASGEPQRALATLQPLLDAKVVDSATLGLAGRIHAVKGDIDRAAEYFEKVVAADPGNAEARTRLGLSRLLGGDTGRAFSDLETAAELESDRGQADIALIVANLHRGDLDKAAAAQRQLEYKQPDIPQTHMLKGAVLLARKDIAGARAAYEKALSLKNDFVPAAAQLARMDLGEKRPEQARKRLEALVAANPKNVEARLLLARLLPSTGAKPKEVTAVLEQAIKANPAAVGPRVELARHHLAAKEPKKALAVAQELAAAHGNDPIALGVLARAQLEDGNRQQAIASLNKIAGLVPQTAAPLLELSEMQRFVGDRAGEERSLRRALEGEPDALEAQQRLIALLVDDKRADEALGIAKTVQKQRPKAAVGLVFEGDIRSASRNWESAAQMYRRALEVAPSPAVTAKLHSAQLQAGKPAEAAKTTADWLRSHPKDLFVRSYLAERALAERRLDEAERLYRKVDELSPNNPLVLNNMAWIAAQRQDPRAMELARRAQSLAPDNPAILDTLGMLQVEHGQSDEGLDNLRRAVGLAPGAGEVRLNLARAYVKVGRRDEARRELDQLIERSPEGSPLRAEATSLKGSL